MTTAIKISLKVFLSFFFLIFLSIWLVFCALISIPGWFLEAQRQVEDDFDADKYSTICKSLFKKGLIDQSTYKFEVKKVALYYNRSVFKGYIVLAAPIVFVINKFSFFDDVVLYFLNYWVQAHKYIFNQRFAAPPKLVFILIKTSTKMAESFDKSLRLLRLRQP